MFGRMGRPLVGPERRRIVVDAERVAQSWSLLKNGNAYELVENCNAAIIEEAAEFLVENFWLQTPRHWTDPEAANVVVPNRSVLVQEQADDLMTKYGERLGSKLLKSGLIWIRSSSCENREPLGLVALAEVLMRPEDGAVVLTPEDSIERIQYAVSSLGPKQRRSYQKASAKEIVKQLLPQHEIICLVSNLSVAVAARRQGTGLQLCQAAEDVARDVWGHDRLYLKVESTNEAAIGLYQRKLQYSEEFSISNDSGVRLDTTKGAYTIQQSVPTLLMSKRL